MGNQNMENNQGQQQGTNDNQQQDNQGQSNQSQQSEKLFTQDDVNRIVQDRLARYKGNGNNNGSSDGLTERERNLNKRELTLEARERLADAGLPKDLLDAVAINSKEDMEKSINALTAYFKDSAAGGRTSGSGNENTYKQQLEQMRNEKTLTEMGVRAADMDYIMFKAGQRVDGKTDFKAAAEAFLKENPRFTGPTYRVSTGIQTRGNDTAGKSDAEIRKAMGLKGQ